MVSTYKQDFRFTFFLGNIVTNLYGQDIPVRYTLGRFPAVTYIMNHGNLRIGRSQLREFISYLAIRVERALLSRLRQISTRGGH